MFKVTNGGGAKTPPEETAADPELAKYLNRDYWQSKQVLSTGYTAIHKIIFLHKLLELKYR